jgi:hypothetical protein
MLDLDATARLSLCSTRAEMPCCSEPRPVYVLPRLTAHGWSRLCLNCAHESGPGATGPIPDPPAGAPEAA